MPVLTVTAAALESRDANLAALRRLGAAVADALGLDPGDVYAAQVNADAAVLGDREVTPWPVIVLHGRAREPDRMAAALTAAEQVACQIWQCASDAVWAQWAVRP
jgi:hypothetical protein